MRSELSWDKHKEQQRKINKKHKHPQILNKLEKMQRYSNVLILIKTETTQGINSLSFVLFKCSSVNKISQLFAQSYSATFKYAVLMKKFWHIFAIMNGWYKNLSTNFKIFLLFQGTKKGQLNIAKTYKVSFHFIV